MGSPGRWRAFPSRSRICWTWPGCARPVGRSCPSVAWRRRLESGLSGLRVLWSGDLGFAAAEPAVVAVCEAAARSFAALGAAVGEGHPQLDDPWPIVDAIWCANQAAPYAGRFDEVRERL